MQELWHQDRKHSIACGRTRRSERDSLSYYQRKISATFDLHPPPAAILLPRDYSYEPT